jgi:hypothetical protein
VPIPQEEGSSGPSVREIATYGSFGLSGVLLAAGLYSSLKVNSINAQKDDIVQKYKGDGKAKFAGDVCSRADEILGKEEKDRGLIQDAQTISDGCSSGGTYQIVQFIFYGLSAASAGAGAYLLMSDSHPDDQQAAPAMSRVHVIPTVGQNAGSLTVRFSF